MTEMEEKIINDKLEEIMEKLQIDQQEFQKNAIYHTQDPTNQERLFKIQKNGQKATNGTLLSKEKALETFKKQQGFQLIQMEKMMNDPSMQNMNQMTNESKMEMMLKALVEQHRAQDELFKETGVEEEQLLYTIDQLNLESDPEFDQIVKESSEKAN